MSRSLLLLFPVLIYLGIEIVLTDSPYKFALIAFYISLFSSLICFQHLVERRFKILSGLITSIILLLAWIEASHWIIFDTTPTAAVYIGIFETDIAEGLEFILGQETERLFFILLLPLSGSVLSLIRIKEISKTLKFFVIGFSLILTIYNFQPIFYSSFLKLIPQFVVYLNEQENFNLWLKSFRQADFKISKFREHKNHKVIFVIGESTTRNRMSLYGYSRETTPRLKQQYNLLAFKNVVSSHTQTSQSLRRILTLANAKKDHGIKRNTHILALAKEAGYQTAWISNQKPLGRFENAQTMIAKEADRTIWLNDNLGFDKNFYDEKVIPHLTKLLRIEKNQFIVIHLMGAHAYYKKRYPENFNNFNDRVPNHPLTLNEEQWSFYNEYDNAVLYQDFVLNEILTKLRENAESYTFIYFPDHGEEAYQSKIYSGHSIEMATDNMYEVPLLLSSSDKGLMLRGKSRLTDPWCTENFIHVLHSILGIKSEIHDPGVDFLHK